MSARKRAWVRVRRHVLPSDAFALTLLSVVAAGLAALTIQNPRWMPPAALILPVLAGGFLLSVRSVLILLAVVALALGWQVTELGLRAVRPGSVGLVGVTALLVLVVARSRARLGVQGLSGESMLVDLRDRLRAQGEVPPLPEGWHAEVVLRSAGGAQFSGDFLVASRSTDGRMLELALVDVSGKGVAAGTRALLLSGAFGGLLGALPHEEFLRAANTYLVRQGWDEGFATAAHLALDLESGDYVISSAGHPPAVQFIAGSGHWRVAAAAGTLLGFVPDATYVGEKGRLDPGDALLLFTDGVIEIPGRDLSVGIDKLLGEADRLVTRGFRRGAKHLVDSVAADVNDDRALVLIWRT